MSERKFFDLELARLEEQRAELAARIAFTTKLRDAAASHGEEALAAEYNAQLEAFTQRQGHLDKRASVFADVDARIPKPEAAPVDDVEVKK